MEHRRADGEIAAVPRCLGSFWGVCAALVSLLRSSGRVAACFFAADASSPQWKSHHPVLENLHARPLSPGALIGKLSVTVPVPFDIPLPNGYTYVVSSTFQL